MSNNTSDAAQAAVTAHMYRQYYLVSFWIEATIYGVYLSLFAFALGIMLRKRALDTTASRVFLIGIVSMFVIISFDNFVNVYRMLAAYASSSPDVDAVTFLQDWTKWDAYGFPIILGILVWIGDILVIYRCFLIWKKNYYVVALPIALLLVSIGMNAVGIWWWRHTSAIPSSVMDRLYKVTFPLNFVQNVLTTCLISWKIVTQARVSRGSGFSFQSAINLITVVRIIVESALIYTLQVFILIVLYSINHPAEVIVQHALVPSIGIVFVLIAIRIHIAKSSSGSGGGQSESSVPVPTWLSGMEEQNDHLRSRRTIPVVNVSTTTEQHRMQVMTPRKTDFEVSATSQRGDDAINGYHTKKLDSEGDSDINV